MRRPRYTMCLVVFLLIASLLSGCKEAVPSSSFNSDVSVEQKAQESVEKQVEKNHEQAEENVTQAEEKIKQSTDQAYEKIMKATETAQQLGMKGLAQRFLYKIYVVYYTLCGYAIPIMCVGWGLALFLYFIFGKLKAPKYQKMAIVWLGCFVTIVMCVILFLPMFIKSLGA